MKKVLAGFCITVITSAATVAVVLSVPVSRLAGWSLPSEGLLATLHQAGPVAFFGICACFMVLSLVVTAAEKALISDSGR